MQNKQIAERIKLLCKNNNISITALLDCYKIRKSLIYDLEKRDTSPSTEILTSIAEHFNVSIDYIAGRTDKPDVNK